MDTLNNLNDNILNEREVAARLGVGQSTLARWRTQGYGPAIVRLSVRRIGYRASEIDRWLRSREQVSDGRRALGEAAASANG